MVAASVRGSRHERMGLPNQDACDCRITSKGVVVAAVADGAGSAQYSQIGSQTAVQRSLELLCARKDLLSVGTEDSWCVVATQMVEQVRNAIAQEALRRDVSPNHLATTLLLFVATEEWVAALQIGDGAIVVGDSTENLFSLTRPQSGEYINETIFITSPDALRHAQFAYSKMCCKYAALFTDGLEMLLLKMPEATPYQPFFQRIFAKVDSGEMENSQLSEYLQSSRVRSRTDDDLTLVLIRRAIS